MSSADLVAIVAMTKERRNEFARSYEELASLISQRLEISLTDKTAISSGQIW